MYLCKLFALIFEDTVKAFMQIQLLSNHNLVFDAGTLSTFMSFVLVENGRNKTIRLNCKIRTA